MTPAEQERNDDLKTCFGTHEDNDTCQRLKKWASISWKVNG